MRSPVFVIVFVLSFVATPASAYVVGVEYQSSGFPVITNLYNVQIGTDFFDVSFDGSFGSSIFLGDETGALLANNALIDILNMTFEQYPPAVFPLVGPVDSPVGLYVIHTSATEGYGSILAAGWLGANGGGEPGIISPSLPYVETQFVAVPEPGSALLAGIGLVGLAIRSRLLVRTHGYGTPL